ncbi:MarR family winged helix-turn-helix transcriptional regulator [Vallitalea sp.]|jgi:DNA-binding MarR family transcriptional regulator|uniref:MarR family winged helix-turn-helix transcriptional regulator n=1 Tax=Vallitalea sp. TaxID=1882829 RepID=UPI0025D5A7DF|nr:MarR family transcriptional regulator [Vallitalea sp.]MCT4688139.1 MarR family transcriptional regulator [Vallitalea sp.]
MDKYDKIKLENQICFPLYALSREIIKLYKPLLSKYNLTYTQYVTMLVIWEEQKIIFKEIGRRLHLDSGTLTPVIKKLESMGLITKYRNIEDDRLVTIELTQKGLLLRDDIVDVPTKLYSQFKGNEESLTMLKKYLDLVLKNISK